MRGQMMEEEDILQMIYLMKQFNPEHKQLLKFSEIYLTITTN